MMRRTLESVAAERLNKLGKNPNIISSRQDLKSDRETLKDIVAKASPIPSSRSSSEGRSPNLLSKSRSFHAGLDPIHNNDNSEVGDSPTTSGASPKPNRLKQLKSNLHIHIPNINILRKSPSTPSKLSKLNDNSPEVNLNFQ